MPTSLSTHVLLRAFADELVRSGVTDACTSPGSRSTPLVLALAREERLRTWSHLDERSAGFFALGLAKAAERPVVVACTSGTAAVELAPAVHEAHEAGVPLIVLTADRPPELRGVGAGQVVDQIKLYGTAAKWFVELGNHEATTERVRWIRSLACRAVAVARNGRPGVVHVNVPLREPLVTGGPLEAEDPCPGRPDGAPWLVLDEPRPGLAGAAVPLVQALEGRRRGVIVAGRDRHPAYVGTVVAFAEAMGWPLLADPLSGARRGPNAIAHYDALLRRGSDLAFTHPDVVLRVGDLPTSKPLRQWLASLGDVPQVAFTPPSVWSDPDGLVGVMLDEHAPLTLASAMAALRDDPSWPLPDLVLEAADPAWVQAWRDADARAAQAIDATLGGDLSEPQVARSLAAALPDDATLYVASSMPIRDVETFIAVRDRPPRVLSNRGANGIDGTIASAFGAAAADGGGPVALLIGDVAFAYDIGSLVAARRLGLPLTIVLLNNDGGGIFEFLPVAGERDAFEEHVATPHGLDFSGVATLYGVTHVRCSSAAELAAALAESVGSARTTVIEVHTDREENVALHRRVWEAVRAV